MNLLKSLSLSVLCILVAVTAVAQPLVIAHRGASGHLPEHTLAAKVLAYAHGADYIEQDVVMTRDGALVVLHDLTLDRVTDVAQQFPGRARADGRYYVIDFTLAELRSLQVSEPALPGGGNRAD
jgi:glycerophosphoryl diester phosphodiesterase